MDLIDDPAFRKDGGLTVGIGAKNCLYTLRSEWNDTIGVMEGDQKVSRPIRRSCHIRNLGADWSEVALRLPDILQEAGYGPNAQIHVPGHCDGKLDPRNPPDPKFIPTETIPFGKYGDHTISEVMQKDPDYLYYLAENYSPSAERERGRWMAFLRDAIAPQLEERRKEREAKAALAAEKAAENKARNEPLAVILSAQSRQPSDFCGSMAEQLRKGDSLDEMPPRALSIIQDIYAKGHGRRGSKGYTEAQEQFTRTFLHPSAPEVPTPVPTPISLAAKPVDVSVLEQSQQRAMSL
jgi:hypothetical protein